MTDVPRRKYVKIPPHIKFLMGARPFDDELVHLAAEFWENSIVGTEAEKSLLIAGNSRCPSRVRAGLGLAWVKHFASYSGDKCILYPFRTVATPRGIAAAMGILDALRPPICIGGVIATITAICGSTWRPESLLRRVQRLPRPDLTGN